MTIYNALDHAIPVVFQSALLTAALVIGAGLLVRKQLLAGERGFLLTRLR